MECPVGKYKLGIPVIDDQHQALAALTTRLMENPSEKFSGMDNAELIHELALLTDLHFKTEELYMRSIQLPSIELQKHVAAHQRILNNLSSLSTNAGNLELLTIGDVIPKFAHWFSGHLIDYDYSLKKY